MHPSATHSQQTPESRFATLPALRIENLNTHSALALRLYDAEGHVEEASATQLDSLLCDARDSDGPRTTRLDRRTLQLVFRAAYHFHVTRVEVVSAYREPGRRREGLHGLGKAVDFRLPKVSAAALAAYLRGLPRVGVGVYTHRRTQYVHLDVREQSYHWLDASPPGKTWRERSLGNATRHDASYTPAADLPEF